MAPPRFRGNSQRARSGGRGGPRSGRGRGALRSRGPRFDSSRLAEVQNQDEGGRTEDSESANEVSAAEDDSNESTSADENAEASVIAERPYATLMRSLLAASEPPAKRRKANVEPSHEHGAAVQSTPVDGAGESRDVDVDFVDDAEETLDQAAAEQILNDESDEVDLSDPFETHFADPDDETVSLRLRAIQAAQWKQDKTVLQGTRVAMSVPEGKPDQETASRKGVPGPSALKLKRRIAETMESLHPAFDLTESLIAAYIFNYQDLLFFDRNLSNSESLRRMACLHAVNHVFKTRDRVIKNSARLAHNERDLDLKLRDQGFTRPKVLFLLPTRRSCARMVNMVTSICAPEQQENRKRFDDAFVEKTDTFAEDKPADFRDLFGGNDDDMFRIGVKFTRKTLKFYAQFYNSDMLFASPLGLRMAIGSEEEKDKKLDFDFLSSIELVVLDQADALLMQNWEHIEFIFEHLNLQPNESHGCDFSRVRSWYLDGNSKHFRQTVILSPFNTPELTELARLHCNNWAGKARIQPEYPGVIQKLHGIKLKQTFSRFDLSSIAEGPESRFAYFTSTVIPTLVKRAKDSAGTLVFIPSYLDFVRVRNYFANDSAVVSLSFGTISEYAGVAEASRARSHFLSGRHRVLLYTERAHHFRRYRIKGVRRVIMYGLPDNPLFYQEIAGDFLKSSEQSLALEPGQGSVRVLFSRFDVLKLERVVGSKRVGKMIRERGDVFEFL